MKNRDEITRMAAEAMAEAGWEDGHRISLGDPDDDLDRRRAHRAYAEGVEAGLRWALGDSGRPFPR